MNAIVKATNDVGDSQVNKFVSSMDLLSQVCGPGEGVKKEGRIVS